MLKKTPERTKSGVLFFIKTSEPRVFITFRQVLKFLKKKLFIKFYFINLCRLKITF